MEEAEEAAMLDRRAMFCTFLARIFKNLFGSQSGFQKSKLLSITNAKGGCEVGVA